MILWALALVIFVMNLGYSIVIPILPDLLVKLSPDISKADLLLGDGLFFSGFNLVKILTQVPAGSVADRFGERRVVLAATITYAISLVMLIEARDFTGLYIARMIEGMATGVSYPAAVAIVMRSSSPDRLGRNMSWQVFAGGLGFVMGPLICSWVVDNSFFGLERDLYRPLWYMLYATVASGVVALLAFALIPKPERKTRATAPAPSQAPSSQGDAAPAVASAPEEPKRSVLAVVFEEMKLLARFSTSPPLHYFVAPMLVDKMVITAMLAVLPIHGMALSPNKDFASYLLGLLGLTFALFQPVAGWLSDRVPVRRLLVANLLGMTGGLAALGLAWSTPVFVVFFVIYCVFASVLMTVSMKLVTELYHDKEGRGRAAGVVLSVSDLGTVVGPVLYNHIYGYGASLSFLAMALSGVAATGTFALSAGREKDLPQVDS